MVDGFKIPAERIKIYAPHSSCNDWADWALLVKQGKAKGLTCNIQETKPNEETITEEEAERLRDEDYVLDGNTEDTGLPF